jgi:hypothetical protein
MEAVAENFALCRILGRQMRSGEEREDDNVLHEGGKNQRMSGVVVIHAMPNGRPAQVENRNHNNRNNNSGNKLANC